MQKDCIFSRDHLSISVLHSINCVPRILLVYVWDCRSCSTSMAEFDGCRYRIGSTLLVRTFHDRSFRGRLYFFEFWQFAILGALWRQQAEIGHMNH